MSAFSHQNRTAVLFILPQVLITLIFFIWPTFSALSQSLYYGDVFGLNLRFAGLHNFIDLFSNKDYLSAIWVTVIISIAITTVTLVMGLSIAILVKGRSRTQGIYKTLFLWPYAVAPAIAALLWRFLFHPTLGWLSQIFHKIGITINTAIHPWQALFVIIMAGSWQQCSYNFLFFFAALKMIPEAIMDAAVLDGASRWRAFFQIQLPLLSPTLFFLITMNLMYAFFDTFGIIDIISQGGPGHSTTTLIYKLYQDGFVAMDPGLSSAQSVVLISLIVVLTFIQFRFLEKRVHYG